MRIARSKCLPMPWTRAGVRLIPEGHSANRSLSAIEPVSATAKRKLENGEQRPAPEAYPARAEIPKIAGQRLGSVSVTRGNIAGSHTPGNITRRPDCLADETVSGEPVSEDKFPAEQGKYVIWVENGPHRHQK
jgi:hypothetical protein